jgi:DNA gyrase subunit B
LEDVYPETLPIEIEWSPDAEHSVWKPTVSSLKIHSGIVRSLSLDNEMLESPDYQRFLDLGEKTSSIGAMPYRLVVGEASEEVHTARQLLRRLLDLGGRGQHIQRYKGLGEMNPDQLWETTMDPEKRTLLQVRVDDAVEADRTFSILMGDDVEPRKEFIETNALNVVNLDI